MSGPNVDLNDRHARAKLGTALAVVACLVAASSAAAEAASLKGLDGVYNAQVANLQGHGPAGVAISVHKNALGSKSGIRISLKTRPGPTEQTNHKAHYKVTKLTSTRTGAIIAGTTKLGGKFGNSAFSLAIAKHGKAPKASLTLKDKSGTVRIKLKRGGAFIYKASDAFKVSSTLPPQLQAVIGTYELKTIPVDGLTKYTDLQTGAACTPINANGLATLSTTITNLAPNGYGGLGFEGYWSGPMAYLPNQTSYNLSNNVQNTAEAFGSETIFDQTYRDGRGNFSTHQLSVTLLDWDPQFPGAGYWSGFSNTFGSTVECGGNGEVRGFKKAATVPAQSQ